MRRPLGLLPGGRRVLFAGALANIPARDQRMRFGYLDPHVQPTSYSMPATSWSDANRWVHCRPPPTRELAGTGSALSEADRGGTKRAGVPDSIRPRSSPPFRAGRARWIAAFRHHFQGASMLCFEDHRPHGIHGRHYQPAPESQD